MIGNNNNNDTIIIDINDSSTVYPVAKVWSDHFIDG